jgi:hypothetical protein
MSILDDHCTATAAQQFTTVEADAIRANSFCFTLFFPIFFVFSRVVGSQCLQQQCTSIEHWLLSVLVPTQCSLRGDRRRSDARTREKYKKIKCAKKIWFKIIISVKKLNFWGFFKVSKIALFSWKMYNGSPILPRFQKIIIHHRTVKHVGRLPNL